MRVQSGEEVYGRLVSTASEAPIAGPFGSDGKRFLVAQIDPAASSVPIQVVRNWSAVLAREAR